MTPNQLTKRSKRLSLVLRHKPEALGIELDEHGWTDIDTLLEKLRRVNLPTSRQQLDQLVASNDNKRFAISEDGLRIRANQGHSLAVELQLEERQPPETLFHGTAERFLRSILTDGLKKMNRQHVHLSPDRPTARIVGSRHGKPVILEVDCEAMIREGHRFFLSENGVWLTDEVPARFLRESQNEAPAGGLKAIHANITTLAVDAIVNADNPGRN